MGQLPQELLMEKQCHFRHHLMMRKTLSALMLFSIVVLNVPTATSVTVKAGATCTKLGVTLKSSGIQYLCVKSGKKLVWKKLDSKAAAKPIPVPSASDTAAPKYSMPPVIGPDPSSRAIAFYYGWYGNPEVDGKWIHWDDPKKPGTAPSDIQSDYFPELGAYSSSDEKVIAQQMAWIRSSGIGVIAVSYWPGETSDDRLSKLFAIANHYGIKVTFHIEPSAQRNNTSYADTVIGLYKKFGKEPAFFTTMAAGRYITSAKAHPMFFVWATSVSNIQGGTDVAQSYWVAGNDRIHNEIGALMIACPGVGDYTSAILDGHFDGAYNYVTLHLSDEGYFSWWKALPAGSLYIPSVIPGNSAKRVGYDPKTYVPRRNGAEYDEQWQSAINVPVKPEFITITSWNEWHEGTAIEPAKASYSSSSRSYDDFAPLSNTYYMSKTSEWIKNLEAKKYLPLSGQKIRLTVETTSDWLDLELLKGDLIQPESFTTAGALTRASFTGTHFYANQSIDNASANKSISMKLIATSLENVLTVKADMGAIGTTKLIIEIYDGGNWIKKNELSWSGTSSNGSVFSASLN